MLVDEYIQSIKHLPLDQINQQIEEVCGIVDFFDENDYLHCLQSVDNRMNKDEYGDWQTNAILAKQITQFVSQSYKPQVILEPTCGKGNFILASIDTFDTIEDIYAIEIYKPYLQILKTEILQRYLDRRLKKKICFHFIHCNVFDVDWQVIKNEIANKKLLVIGNPPWVTNSQLSKINSTNLPHKTNFKQEKGLSAITGKGNFDIAEYICCVLFKNFAYNDNHFAILLKNSVIKQICQSQHKFYFPLNNIEQYKIDAKKEFGASVEASLFTCNTGEPAQICNVFDFYTMTYMYQYGRVGEKFVSNIDDYKRTMEIEGVSPVKWWSGIKHDCQSVVELKKCPDGYYNKLGEKIDIEDTYVYPYIKSSDIKGNTVTESNHYVIVTQKKINENTDRIKHIAPKTYQYLLEHISFFEQRKSSIYKNRPPFSMFGIGDYTFKPYKIVVSSLYKEPHFTLLVPIQGRCVVPDDTCYLVGFDTLEQAQFILDILKSIFVSDFIKSVSFSDSKRVITKELLMRINLKSVYHKKTPNEMIDSIARTLLYTETTLFA